MIILPESFIEIAAVAVTQHGGDFFHVLFGAGQLGHLHEETLPGKKALIVTSNGQSAKKYGYLARVEKELDLAGVGHVLFDEIRPNPTRENVMDGAKAVRDNSCDFVLALGDGSVMDCATTRGAAGISVIHIAANGRAVIRAVIACICAAGWIPIWSVVVLSAAVCVITTLVISVRLIVTVLPRVRVLPGILTIRQTKSPVLYIAVQIQASLSGFFSLLINKGICL